MIKYDKKNKELIGKSISKISLINEHNTLVKFKVFKALSQGVYFNPDFMDDFLKEKGDFVNERDEEFFVQSLFYDYLFGEEGNQFEFETFFESSIKTEDLHKFKDNPFIKDIKFDKDINIKKNNICLKMNYYDKYEFFQTNTLTKDKNFVTKPCLGFFKEKVYFPSLYENRNTWMSITPSEINTMKTHIDNMKGDVLIFGLGLGYFPYLTALKDNVSSVTIIELNKDIIDIFNEFILPKMNDIAKNKIKVIQGNAKDVFLDVDFIKNFDTCFIDIWQNSRDGIPLYFFFKENEHIHTLKPSYWIEEDFFLEYQEAMFRYLSYLFFKEYRSPLENKELFDIIMIRDFTEKIDNYFKNKKYIIKCRPDIDKLIFDRELMKKIASFTIDK